MTSQSQPVQAPFDVLVPMQLSQPIPKKPTHCLHASVLQTLVKQTSLVHLVHSPWLPSVSGCVAEHETHVPVFDVVHPE
jgi:hypothetical protein